MVINNANKSLLQGTSSKLLGTAIYPWEKKRGETYSSTIATTLDLSNISNKLLTSTKTAPKHHVVNNIDYKNLGSKEDLSYKAKKLVYFEIIYKRNYIYFLVLCMKVN